jgi:predicted MPP superfamily phosphohydrolase
MTTARIPRVTRRDMLRALAAAGIGAGGGAAAYGFAQERHHIEVTRATLNVHGFPPALAGLRVGFLSDLHRSAMVSQDLVYGAARLLMAERPDLIVLGGDYITAADQRFVEPAAQALGDLAAPHGVFGVLGNHDDDRDMPAALAARGVVVLRDARTRITVRGEPMDLIGIKYWTRRPGDIARLWKGSSPASVLIAHTPARLVEAAALSIPLMLSGHTHGGQVVLPGLGPIAARRFPVVAGIERRQRTTIFVTRGIGTVFVPIRIACPPEVAILTLQPDAS